MIGYETWHYTGIVSFVVAGIFLAIAVIIFFRAHIPSVIAVLNGKAQKKDIEKIRAEMTREGSGRFEYFDKDRAGSGTSGAGAVIGSGKYARPRKAASFAPEAAARPSQSQAAAPSSASSEPAPSATPSAGSVLPKPAEVKTAAPAPAPNAAGTLPSAPDAGRPAKETPPLTAFKFVPATPEDPETDVLTQDGAKTVVLSRHDPETDILSDNQKTIVLSHGGPKTTLSPGNAADRPAPVAAAKPAAAVFKNPAAPGQAAPKRPVAPGQAAPRRPAAPSRPAPQSAQQKAKPAAPMAKFRVVSDETVVHSDDAIKDE
jgi:hypothetical protein